MPSVITGVGVVAGDCGGYQAFRDGLFRPGQVQAPRRSIPLDGFEPSATLGRKGLKFLDRATKMALCAADEALCDARASVDAEGAVDRSRFATVTSCCLGVLETVHQAARTIRTAGNMELSPVMLPNASPNVASSHVAIRNRLYGPNITVANGFSSGLDALMQADLLIRRGRADAVVVIGVESLSREMEQLFEAALPELQSPGLALGEGAAALVLESDETARSRGAAPRAVLQGLAQRQTTGEASQTLQQTLQACLERASLSPCQIDLLLSAECGSPHLAAIEGAGFGAVFAPEIDAALPARRSFAPGGAIRRAAIKARVGETYGAAGLFQVLAGIACLESRSVFASPVEWSEPARFDKVAPMADECVGADLDRLITAAWSLNGLFTAAIISRPGLTASDPARGN